MPDRATDVWLKEMVVGTKKMLVLAVAYGYGAVPYYHPAYYGYPCCGSVSANVYGQYGSTTYSGTRSYYKKLSLERADAVLPLIQQYMGNTPFKMYKVAGVGDMFAPKDASMQVEHRYQSVRAIAVYNTSDLPTVPGI